MVKYTVTNGTSVICQWVQNPEVELQLYKYTKDTKYYTSKSFRNAETLWSC